MWFTEPAMAAWKASPRTTRGGQPRYSALAITTALTLRAVFRLALRQTEGLIASLLRLLGLDLAAPDHSTLSRRGETLPVSRPRPGSEPVHLLVDSTGLKLCGPGEWLVEKHAAGVRRCWRKLHIGLDADTGQIIAAELTSKDVDDGSQVGPLLEQIALITTKGFRDVLEIRTLRMPRLYDLSWTKPPPLVERHLRVEVDERINAKRRGGAAVGRGRCRARGREAR